MGGTLLGIVAGVWILFVAAKLVLHDHGEVQGRPNFQLWCAAQRFQEAAQQAHGTFPIDEHEVRRLLAPSAADVLDPWGRAFRYERIGEDGRRARVFTLGEDARPSGEGCDEDIGYWMDSVESYFLADARNPPSTWR